MSADDWQQPQLHYRKLLCMLDSGTVASACCDASHQAQRSFPRFSSQTEPFNCCCCVSGIGAFVQPPQGYYPPGMPMPPPMALPPGMPPPPWGLPPGESWPPALAYQPLANPTCLTGTPNHPPDHRLQLEAAAFPVRYTALCAGWCHSGHRTFCKPYINQCVCQHRPVFPAPQLAEPPAHIVQEWPTC